MRKQVRLGLKKYDLIKYNDRKYLILKLKMKGIEALPMDPFFESMAENKFVPKIFLSYNSLKKRDGFCKLSHDELLFVVDQDCFLLKTALHELMEKYSNATV